MKILLVIDHFGSGGAQRQIVELAGGLKRRGHTVEMFVYFPRYNFFREEIDIQHIPVHEHAKETMTSLGIVRRLAGLLRSGRFDAAISFQSTANIYSELARIATPRTRLVVSERTNFLDDRSIAGAFVRRLLHRLADQVVANSETQARWLREKPWLRARVSCIYNGVDLQKFRPSPADGAPRNLVRLLGIGRVGPEKNLRVLIEGLAAFEARFGFVPEVHWAGESDGSASGARCQGELIALLDQLPAVRERWRWLGLRNDIPQLLRRYDALVHPSLYEGSPNVVCEALASGVPVLASNVCDHPMLVPDGRNGFLFAPDSPGAVADSIRRLIDLGPEQRMEISRNARTYAEERLGIDRMVESYESLCVSLLSALR